MTLLSRECEICCEKPGQYEVEIEKADNRRSAFVGLKIKLWCCPHCALLMMGILP
jgi:hypothetical protein